MNRISLYFLFFLIICLTRSINVDAQDRQIIRGVVLDQDNKPVIYANIAVKNTSLGTSTDSAGNYQLSLPPMDSVVMHISRIGYDDKQVTLKPNNKVQTLNIRLQGNYEKLDEISVSAKYNRATNMVKLNAKDFEMLPSSSGNIEATIKTLPGVSSRSELSSQYSVRGGNFDENLIYVNDIRIYKPFLIRSGKQEGLSFINSDMVSAIKFSAGGFESVYGDKMSSVLDITYKQPKEFGGSVEISLLGGSANLRGTSRDNKFKHISSVRYKTNKYLFGTLDTEGEYLPVFSDFQTYLSYDLSEKWKLGFLGNYALNRYHFIPETRKTVFGTIQNVYNLKIYYDGQEINKFENYLGALTAEFHPNRMLNMKLITSAYNTNEQETFDVRGQYLINEVNASVGSDDFGDSVMNIGVGTFLRHARNFLDAQIYTVAYKANYYFNQHLLQWGMQYNHETIHDEIWEWNMLDSSGYTLPYSDTSVNLLETRIFDNFIESQRFTSYLQNTSNFILSSNKLTTIAGIRFYYWDFNKELNISPRFSASLTPAWSRKTVFHFSTGYYYQPPFYKEMRSPDGTINHKIKSQRSIHFVLGTEYNFWAWKRPFVFTCDAYYKKMDNLIPYKVRNVRILYSGENQAKGYATGLDMKVNGEFVKGVESWASLSFLQTKADIKDDFYIDENGQKIEPGYYPRPTDQLINFGLFFQDYFPNYPSYRMTLSLNYGSRVPYSIPYTERYDLYFRMPPYKRVDIGFSKVFNADELKNSGLFSQFNSLHIGAEVFNLFDFSNTISYLWVKTISDNPDVPKMFAVPNYLTGRRINIKIKAKF